MIWSVNFCYFFSLWGCEQHSNIWWTFTCSSITKRMTESKTHTHTHTLISYQRKWVTKTKIEQHSNQSKTTWKENVNIQRRWKKRGIVEKKVNNNSNNCGHTTAQERQSLRCKRTERRERDRLRVSKTKRATIKITEKYLGKSSAIKRSEIKCWQRVNTERVCAKHQTEMAENYVMTP